MPNGVPTLQDLIARSGVDPSFFGEFGATEFGGQLGLKGEQLSGFKKFANLMKFNPKQIEDLLSSIGEYGEEQTGFIQEQFGTGLEGMDETGRNHAYTSFRKVSQYILDAYDSLANMDDKEIFVDYLITNLKLYFDKFETEMQSAVEEPTTQSYEDAKKETAI